MRERRFRFPVLALAAPLLLPALAAAQAFGPDEVRSHTQPYIPAPALAIRTGVELVEVPVVVRDRQHKAVAGLSRSDFAIFDSGKKRDITFFSVENFMAGSNPAAAPIPASGPSSAQPAARPKPATPLRYVALCFDDLTTDSISLIRAKRAATAFVKTALAPGDRVAVVTTAWPQTTEFTSDVPAILARIDKVQSNQRYSDNTMDCPSLNAFESYLIANSMDPGLLTEKVAEYRACRLANGSQQELATAVTAKARSVWEAARFNSRATLGALEGLVQGLAKAPGRRMILLASSGFLSGNLETEEEDVIVKALGAGVVINALGARGLYTVVPGGEAAAPQPAGRRAGMQPAELRAQSFGESAKDNGMAILASGTGGAFFHDNNDLLRGFRELGMLPEIVYVLGFAPTDIASDGRFRSLKVRLNSAKNYSVQARMGYNAPPKPGAAPPEPVPESRIDSEMAASDTLADFPAIIAWQANPQNAGVTYVAHIDVSHLKLEMRQDRRVQRLTIVAVLRDAGGNFVAGERSDVDLSLTDATFTRLAASGLNLILTIKTLPGNYAARGLLLDGIEGKMVTSSQQVQLQ